MPGSVLLLEKTGDGKIKSAHKKRARDPTITCTYTVIHSDEAAMETWAVQSGVKGSARHSGRVSKVVMFVLGLEKCLHSVKI